MNQACSNFQMPIAKIFNCSPKDFSEFSKYLIKPHLSIDTVLEI